jgi:hypothetical protein
MNSLSDDEKRYIEYFWSRNTQKIRYSIPITVIAFLEADYLGTQYNSVLETKLIAALSAKNLRRYLHLPTGISMFGQAQFALTNEGIEYLKDRHPKILVLVQRMWEQMPWVTFIITVAGFVAAIIDIVRFLLKGL